MDKNVEEAFDQLRNVCLEAAADDKKAQAVIKAAFVIARHFYGNLTWFLTTRGK